MPYNDLITQTTEMTNKSLSIEENEKLRKFCIDEINDFLTTGWLTNSEAMDKKEVVKLLIIARSVLYKLQPNINLEAMVEH
jgi:hypothetical protein